MPRCVVAAAALFVPAGFALAAEPEVAARIVGESAGGFFADAGASRGVAPGAAGVVERNGREIARVEVASVAPSSSLLRVVALPGLDRPRTGDTVRLAVTREQTSPAEGAPPPARSEAPSENEFVPLLAPPPRAAAPAEPANIFHGTAWVRQLFQTDSANPLDFSLTRVGTSGSLDRIQGTPWAFDWSGAVSYRTGQGYEGSADFDEVRLDLFRLSFYRRFQDGGFVRAGRFLPQELPATGYIDGAQGETPIGEHFRLGAIAGLKPTRDDLDFSIDEPTAVGYATFAAGDARNLYYSGTLGVLGSLYKGKLDRVALLVDQRATLSPRLSLFSTTEVDVYAGSAETSSSDVRLTHQDLYVVSPVTRFLTLRAGFDHYEGLDTQAERDVLDVVDDRLFGDGYWRYWTGATVLLPWRLELDGEAAYIESEAGEDGIRWRAGLARTGIFAWTSAQVRIIVYNLDGADASGYGGRVSAYLPLLDGSLSFEPAVGFRLLETDSTSESFDITDLGLRAWWQITNGWSADAGVMYTTGTGVDALLVDLGVSFTW
jgi:hypothetical protein